MSALADWVIAIGTAISALGMLAAGFITLGRWDEARKNQKEALNRLFQRLEHAEKEKERL